MLAGFLTGLTIEAAAAADDSARGNCPPLPPGPPPGVERDAGGPPPYDRREHGPHDGRGAEMLLTEFDLDKDGRVSRQEIDRVLKSRFDAADTNHDGKLYPQEFAHVPPMGPEPFGRGMHHHHSDCGPPPGEHYDTGMNDHPGPGPGTGPDHHPPFDPKVAFNHLDWNLDGELTFEEFAAPIRQMALHLDRNGDGVIDAEEMKGPMMFGPGFGPPPGPPPEPPRDR